MCCISENKAFLDASRPEAHPGTPCFWVEIWLHRSQGSIYCSFKDSGSKNRTRNSFWNQSPEMGSVWTLRERDLEKHLGSGEAVSLTTLVPTFRSAKPSSGLLLRNLN